MYLLLVTPSPSCDGRRNFLTCQSSNVSEVIIPKKDSMLGPKLHSLELNPLKRKELFCSWVQKHMPQDFEDIEKKEILVKKFIEHFSSLHHKISTISSCSLTVSSKLNLQKKRKIDLVNEFQFHDHSYSF
jgi:hypothetical protein